VRHCGFLLHRASPSLASTVKLAYRYAMQDHRAANSVSKWGWKVHASGSPIQELIQVKQVAHMVESGLIEKPSPSFLVLLVCVYGIKRVQLIFVALFHYWNFILSRVRSPGLKRARENLAESLKCHSHLCTSLQGLRLRTCFASWCALEKDLLLVTISDSARQLQTNLHTDSISPSQPYITTPPRLSWVVW
jgi:hypothetical protein